MKWKKQRRRNASGLLLVVARDHHDRTVTRLDELARLVDEELHPVELEQQVVRELYVGLVDLVDQQHRLDIAVEASHMRPLTM